ncbi:hypothetical protein LSH36_11g03103 [Paralvinella palmiformis]|uniref:UDENN FLCN/SMCR8-type domain-containing protein n=1 Tax=Paralvinella palmiformis TaxID=53620 RepID=A0AAD9KDL8_9ANNE|nr:hypothetical protein LSH36_11g03103 [Paralvinella palmiformis]
MFGGYTEVAAYYVNTPWRASGEDSSDADGEQLPPDYNAQNVCPDPWHKRAACQNDFIMIAEFSEQEGPKPYGGGSFDLNEFSVRIMSADFQTASGSTFNMSEDTQVIMSETTNGLYAFVHHFTLYDYQARGFVRPFCMSYVTPDQNKLFSEFEDLSSQFKKVAHCFKSGNLDLFVKDLTHYLSDLHYTKQRYLEMEQSLLSLTEDDQHKMSFLLFDHQEETLLKTVTPTALDNIIKEVKAILEVTSNTLTELEVLSPVDDLDDADNSRRAVGSDTLSKGLTDDKVALENFRYSCSLHSRSPSHLTKWTDQRERASSVSQVISSWTDEKDIYKPKLVRTTKRRFEKSLRTLHELCMWGAKEGLNRLRNLHKYFSRDLYVLHMEQIDAESMEPACSVLTVGRTIIINYMDHSDLDTGLTDVDWDSTNSNNCLDRRWFSSETMTSFHSADSFLSCVDDISPTRGQQQSTPVPISGNGTITESDAKDGTKNNMMPSPGSDLTQTSDVDLEKLHFSRTSSATGSLETAQDTLSIPKSEAKYWSSFSGIVPYHKSPLCINDIVHAKLIGLCRPERRKVEHMVPSSVRQYVTIFDIEKKAILAPEYKGELLRDLCIMRRSFSTDQICVAYIHSILYHLAVKSFVYFHKFCLGCEEAKSKHSSRTTDEWWLSPYDKLLFCKMSVSDLGKLHVCGQDVNIIQYLSEVVKSQHVNKQDESESGSCTANLDYIKCSWFKATT